jgi:hypothetical protein
MGRLLGGLWAHNLLVKVEVMKRESVLGRELNNVIRGEGVVFIVVGEVCCVVIPCNAVELPVQWPVVLVYPCH